METSALLALNSVPSAISNSPFRSSVQSHPNGETAIVLPNDLNAAEGFASRPQSNGIEAPFPQPRRSLFCEFLYVRDFRHTMHPRIDLRCWFSLNLGPVANGGFSLRCPTVGMA